MSLLIFERSQVVAFADEGLMNKKSVLHYDICADYKSGKTVAEISKKYGIDEFRNIFTIIDRKCPECKRK